MLSYELVDDAAPLAHSLAASARAGEALVAGALYRIVRRAFVLREHAARGPSGVRAFALERARSRTERDRTSESQGWRLLGRETSLRELRNALVGASVTRAGARRTGHGRARHRQDHRARRLRGRHRDDARHPRRVAGDPRRRVRLRPRRAVRLRWDSSCGTCSRCATRRASSTPAAPAQPRRPESDPRGPPPLPRRRGSGEVAVPIDSLPQLLDAVSERYGQGPRGAAPRCHVLRVCLGMELRRGRRRGGHHARARPRAAPDARRRRARAARGAAPRRAGAGRRAEPRGGLRAPAQAARRGSCCSWRRCATTTRSRASSRACRPSRSAPSTPRRGGGSSRRARHRRALRRARARGVVGRGRQPPHDPRGGRGPRRARAARSSRAAPTPASTATPRRGRGPAPRRRRAAASVARRGAHRPPRSARPRGEQPPPLVLALRGRAHRRPRRSARRRRGSARAREARLRRHPGVRQRRRRRRGARCSRSRTPCSRAWRARRSSPR